MSKWKIFFIVIGILWVIGVIAQIDEKTDDKKIKQKAEIYLAMKTLAIEGKVSVRPKDVYGTLNLVTQSDKNNINKNMQRMREKCELLSGEKHGEYKLACRIEDIDSLGNLIAHTHDNF